MVTPILSRSIWRYFFRHPWVILLSILGVAIGVAVVVSVDIANTSAQRAFELSVEGVTGRATHQVVGGPLGLDEEVYTDFRLEFAETNASSVVEGYVVVEGETLQMLGMDYFSDSYFGKQLSGASSVAMMSLLLKPDTVMVAAKTAERLRISTGDSIVISVGGEDRKVNVVGLVGELDDSMLDGIIATDVSTAQEILGRVGYIDRINVVLAEDRELLTSIEEWLPEGATVFSTAARNESTLNMTSAFSTNLTAMSLLALLVGMFLIFNTMTFSVLQRRELIGSLRAIGATRREIFTEIIIEAGIIGFIGTLIGLLLGIMLGQGMVKLVLRTVNDIYFVLTVSSFFVSGGVIIKGIFLGVATSVVAAFIPALEAASSPPQVVRFRSVMESLAHRLLPYISLAGILMMAVSIVILFFAGDSIIAGFVSLFMLVIGFALCVPILVKFISEGTGLAIGKRTGILTKMAATGISGSISRTGTAIAAMAVAVSVVVGMGTMIDSFRGTVDRWLEQSLQGDIYITTTSDVSRRSENPLPDYIVEGAKAIDNVAAIKTMKTIYVESKNGLVEVHAINTIEQSRREYKLKEGDEVQAWESFASGKSIFVAEPYTYKNDVSLGDSISLMTEEGWQEFTISGIYYDYATDQGIVLISQDTYTEYWHDNTVSSMSLYLKEGADKESITDIVRDLVDGAPGVLVRDNLDIRQSGLNIFDQTFLITRVLEFLVIIVAFIGILSSLMAYQLEKQKEIGVLRATGVTPRQIWGMIGLQTGFMGAISGALAVPLGLVVAVILIVTINIRSFGWSMQIDISAGIILEALAIAIGAAILASIYPAWRMSRISPAEALREE
ncbi:MAG TPA: FtsX-like permease family protein [Dehalococcoidia bacterium]|nr:FtsX-like permease family protein [Dehalococcoidia bacterium]